MERPYVIFLVIGENDIKQDTVPSTLASELVQTSEDFSRWGGGSKVLISTFFQGFINHLTSTLLSIIMTVRRR